MSSTDEVKSSISSGRSFKPDHEEFVLGVGSAEELCNGIARADELVAHTAAQVKDDTD